MAVRCTRCGYHKPVKVIVRDANQDLWQAKTALYESIMDYQSIELEEALKPKPTFIEGVIAGALLVWVMYWAGVWF